MQNLGTCFSGGHGGGSRLRVTPEVFSTFNHPVIPRDRTRSPQIRGPPVLFHLQPPRDWKGMKLDPSDSRPTPAPLRIPGHRAGGGSREPWRHRRARARRRGGAGPGRAVSRPWSTWSASGAPIMSWWPRTPWRPPASSRWSTVRAWGAPGPRAKPWPSRVSQGPGYDRGVRGWGAAGPPLGLRGGCSQRGRFLGLSAAEPFRGGVVAVGSARRPLERGAEVGLKSPLAPGKVPNPDWEWPPYVGCQLNLPVQVSVGLWPRTSLCTAV